MLSKITFLLYGYLAQNWTDVYKYNENITGL